MKKCAFDECGVMFEPQTHNQVYHTPECCRQATNNRIKANYHAKRARRKGGRRECETPGCQTLLSRYNDSYICQFCESQKETEDRIKLIQMLVN